MSNNYSDFVTQSFMYDNFEGFIKPIRDFCVTFHSLLKKYLIRPLPQRHSYAQRLHQDFMEKMHQLVTDTNINPFNHPFTFILSGLPLIVKCIPSLAVVIVDDESKQAMIYDIFNDVFYTLSKGILYFNRKPVIKSSVNTTNPINDIVISADNALTCEALLIVQYYLGNIAAPKLSAPLSDHINLY
jgi:hypothetical protein